jgi:hypothetical protein
MTEFDIIFDLVALTAEVWGKRSNADIPAPQIDRKRAFRQALGKCPSCDRGFKDHHFALLGATRPDTESQDDVKLWELLEAERWDEARALTPERTGEGLLVAYAYRCVAGRRAGWFTMFFAIDATDLPFTSRIESFE